MIRILTLVMLAATVGACTVPTYEADPVSVYQWERRQERITREEAQRVATCQAELTRQGSDAKCSSARHISREPRQCDGSELGVHSQVIVTLRNGACLIETSNMP